MVTHRRSAIEGDVRLTMVSGVQHWRPALTSGVGVRSYRPAAGRYSPSKAVAQVLPPSEVVSQCCRT
jgi:hypothetical protein